MSAGRPPRGRELPGRLVVVTGTGTEIGKTHVACQLVSLGSLDGTAAGFKPVETGVVGEGADVSALRAVSSFHVKHLLAAPFLFSEGLSPHLAARGERRHISIDAICEAVKNLRAVVDLLIVELAGGLFTPLGDDVSNCDLAIALVPDRVILVAPDRLGVLHDLGATTRAATAAGCRIDAIVLNAPASADASTGRNAMEIRRVAPGAVVVGPLARARENAPSDAHLLSPLLKF
jgi:dethiobiotin synthetase